MFEDIKPISRTGTPAQEPKRRAAAVAQASEPADEAVFEVPVRTGPKTRRKEPVRIKAPLPREVPFAPEPPRPSSAHALWYVAGLAVVAFCISLSFLFEHATVTVVPKSVPIALDSTDSFTAQKDSTDASSLSFTEMTLSGDQTMNLPSTQTKSLSVAAQGTAVLYNAYSPSPYKLVKGTRLETTDGRIYRIDAAATIPGDSKSGGTLTPGSIEVTATADTPGAAGNLDTADFTLPGLTGTAQASSIYARSKTAFTGGISGTVYTVPQETADAAVSSLSDKLKASLIAKAKVQVPDGYLFYDAATAFQTDTAVQVPYSQTTDVPIALHGTLTAYLLKQDSLVQDITQKFVSQYAGEPVTLPALQGFALTPSTALDPANDTSFTFTLAGTGNIVWVVDPVAIQKLLVGTKKADFETIMAQVSGADKAQVDIKPFWKQSFPNDITRIGVTVQAPSS